MDVREQEVARFKLNRPSLRVNFSWVLAGNLIYAASGYALLMVLAKLGSPSDVGRYSLGVAIAMPTIMLTNLGLSAALVTDVARDCPYGRYVSLRLLSAVLSVIIIAGIALGAGYPRDTTLVIALVGVGASLSAIRQILLAIMRRNERMNLSARSQMIVSCGSVVAFCAVFWFSGSLAWAVVALCVSRMAVILLNDIPCAHRLAKAVGSTTIIPEWSVGPLVSLGLTAAPMAVAMTLTSLISNIPKYILEHHHGAAALGFFAPLAHIMLAGSMLMNSLGTAVTPRLATYFVENRRAYLRLVLRLVLIALGMGMVGVIVAVLIGRQVLTLLLNPEYAEYNREFTLLMVNMAIMLVVSFVNHSVVASRGFKHVSVVNALVGILCIAASILFIKPHGIVGACWAMLATSTCWLLILVPVFWVRLRSASSPPGAA